MANHNNKNHAPRVESPPDDKDLLPFTEMPSENLGNAMLVKLVLAVENVDLGQMWTGIKHIQKNINDAPSVLFIDLDPYLTATSRESENFFKIGSTHEARPQSAEAIERMIATGNGFGSIARPDVEKPALTMTVSRLTFSSSGNAEVKEAYDALYETNGVIAAIEKEQKGLSERAKAKEDPSEEAERASLLSKKKNEAHQVRQAAVTNWNRESEKVISTLSDRDIFVQHAGDWTNLESLFPSHAIHADRAIFRAAAMDTGHFSIVFGYRGDFNIRRKVTSLLEFGTEWFSHRSDNMEEYRKLLESVRDGEDKSMPPGKWALPRRVTDYFIFNLPFSGIRDFVDEIVGMRAQMERHITTALKQFTEKSSAASQEDFGSTLDGK